MKIRGGRAHARGRLKLCLKKSAGRTLRPAGNEGKNGEIKRISGFV